MYNKNYVQVHVWFKFSLFWKVSNYFFPFESVLGKPIASSHLYILRVCKYFGYPREQLTKLFDLLIMSLFLYGIEIWRAAYQGKYLDRIDKFFKQAFRFRYTNKLYAIAEVIRNRDCKLWNTITDTPSHPLYQLLLPKKQRFLWNRGHDFILPAVKTECFKRYFINRCLFNFI